METEGEYPLLLQCDYSDYVAIQEALKMRESWNAMPSHHSNREGALVAEICRGWMELHEWQASASDPEKPEQLNQPTTSGAGA